jgi:hypothetical protein
MPRRWRLSLNNARVRLTMEFKLTGGSRCVRGGSTLSIDGVQVERAEDFEHFVRIFADPDAEYGNRQITPPGWDAAVEEKPADDVPKLVRDTVKMLTRKLSDTAAFTVGTAGTKFWVVEIRMNLAVLRVSFHMWADGTCCLVEDPLFLLMVDGIDVTEQVNGQLDKALAMMNRPAHDAAPEKRGITGAAGTTRDVGVETRRTTVLRL